MMFDPIAFQLGPLSIRWYGILTSTALLIGVLLALREIRRRGIDEDKFMNIIIAAIPAGFLCARLYYVLFSGHLDYYLANPGEILAVWHGGLAIHGGVIGAFLVGGFMVQLYNMHFWTLGDIVAPSLILGQAIGRWGNFFNQEAYGYEVDPEVIPWAMWIDGAYRHPTFLYESLWNLMIFGFLLWFRRRPETKEGEVLLSYFVLYSTGRFFIEGLRTDSLMLGPFRVAQLISLTFIIGALALIWYRRKQEKAKIYR